MNAPTDFPATISEWATAVLRLLVSLSQRDWPWPLSLTLKIAILEAKSLVRLADRGDDLTDPWVGGMHFMATLYDALFDLAAALRVQNAPLALAEANRLMSRYTQIVGVGCTILPLNPLPPTPGPEGTNTAS